jgi:endo-1,4-beta-xylanase
MEVSDGYQTVGTNLGSVSSDGGTYEIWEHQQVNQPSILGTSTFEQYISIRQGSRTSGTVTVENHFSAWAKAGLNLGTFNYQVMAVESWTGSGSGQISLSKGTGSTTPPTSTTSAGSSPTGGSCSALYGQCGGIDFAGPTCCSAGTCQVGNPWYSQCLE